MNIFFRKLLSCKKLLLAFVFTGAATVCSAQVAECITRPGPTAVGDTTTGGIECEIGLGSPLGRSPDGTGGHSSSGPLTRSIDRSINALALKLEVGGRSVQSHIPGQAALTGFFMMNFEPEGPFGLPGVLSVSDVVDPVHGLSLQINYQEGDSVAVGSVVDFDDLLPGQANAADMDDLLITWVKEPNPTLALPSSYLVVSSNGAELFRKNFYSHENDRFLQTTEPVSVSFGNFWESNVAAGSKFKVRNYFYCQGASRCLLP